jgi:hypothetical protein
MHDHAITYFMKEDFRSSYHIFLQTLERLQTLVSDGENIDESPQNESLKKMNDSADLMSSHIPVYMRLKKSIPGGDDVFWGVFSLARIFTEIIKNEDFVSADIVQIATAVVLFNIGLTGHILAMLKGPRYVSFAKNHYGLAYDVIKATYQANNIRNNQCYLEVVSLLHLALCLNIVHTRSSAWICDSSLRSDANERKNTVLYSEMKRIVESFVKHKTFGGEWLLVTAEDIHFFFVCVSMAHYMERGSIAAAAA